MSQETQLWTGIGAAIGAILAIAVDNLAVVPIDESPDFVRFVVFSVLSAGVAAAIFLILLPWAQAEPEPGERLSHAGFALAMLGLASLIVFFVGLPIVLGAGAFVFGWLAEEGAPGEEGATAEKGATAERRASLGWAAAFTGALEVAACLVLFALAALG